MTITEKKLCNIILVSALVLMAGTGCRKSVQSSTAMAPTIQPGEKVTIDFLAYALSSPQRWDVVALEPPIPTNIMVLKRVIALPSETISLTSSGIVINDRLLSMPASLSNVAYCSPERLSAGQTFIKFPHTVPPKHYFVVGDNWNNSLDSRHYGSIGATNILGKVKGK